MKIGNTLRKFREIKGYTQSDVAVIAEIDDKYYGRIERDESNPTIKMLEKICKAFDIQLIELFIIDIYEDINKIIFSPQICRLITDSLKNCIDVHINKEIIISGCENCIWYHGYIGSLSFDEFELKMYAMGNIKAKLYLQYKEVLNLNSADISIELSKYVKSDSELEILMEYMSYDKKILEEKSGNAFFAEESNWLSATLINNQNKEIMYEGIILDTDNIFDGLRNSSLLFDCLFGDFDISKSLLYETNV